MGIYFWKDIDIVNREENTASLLVLVLKLGVGFLEIYFVIASRIIYYAIFVYGISHGF